MKIEEKNENEFIVERFSFYKSFYQAISSLDKVDDQEELLNAIFNFALLGKEPQFKNPYLKPTFIQIKAQILSNKNKVSNCNKGKQHKSEQKEKVTMAV